MSGQSGPAPGQNGKRQRCQAGREYKDAETEQVIKRVQCGYDKKHVGPHTFEMERQSVTVQIKPVQLPRMDMKCPGCGAFVQQIIPGQMAQAIHAGGEPQGQCDKCGLAVTFCKQQLILARR